MKYRNSPPQGLGALIPWLGNWFAVKLSMYPPPPPPALGETLIGAFVSHFHSLASYYISLITGVALSFSSRTDFDSSVLFYNISPLEAPINLSTCTRHIMTSHIFKEILDGHMCKHGRNKWQKQFQYNLFGLLLCSLWLLEADYSWKIRLVQSPPNCIVAMKTWR